MKNIAPAPLDHDAIQQIVSDAVRRAIDFVETEIAPSRKKAQDYFDGLVDIGEEEGRSRAVSTKVRDTIRAVKPSLMRIFLSNQYPVEFKPVGPDDAAAAEQATAWVVQKFRKNGGYRIIRDSFHDALLKKTGFAKVVWENKDRVSVATYTGLTEDELALLMSEQGVEVIAHTQRNDVDIETGEQVVVHDVKISITVRSGDAAIYPVPPERFFVDARATSIEDCRVCGSSEDIPRGDVVSMFDLDWEDVADLDLAAAEDIQGEESTRRGYSVDLDYDGGSADPAMQLVTITEAYMRVDIDGTGMPVLHRFILGGSAYKLLAYEPADDVQYAVFEIDPEPHSFFGRSIFDLIKAEQDIATSILRGILDNVAMTNNPRIGIVEGSVNVDDILNNEVGAIVRLRSSDAVKDLSVPFTAGQTLSALQYVDGLVEEKTGVTKASTGLNPDALQSTTKAAVTATIQAAAGQVEVIAANLADGGVSRLFRLLLKLYVKHATKTELMRLNGSFVPVDPRVWDVDMDLEPNVGLGTGREEDRALALDAIIAWQKEVLQTMGRDNGLVTLTHLRNAMADKLTLSGIRNPDRYMSPMNSQIEEQMRIAAANAAAGQQQPAAPDPNASLIAAEQIKAGVKTASDQARLSLEQQKLVMDDDRERDKMAQELALRQAEMLLKYGRPFQLPTNTPLEQDIRMQQQMPRPITMPMPAPAPVDPGLSGSPMPPQQQPWGQQ